MEIIKVTEKWRKTQAQKMLDKINILIAEADKLGITKEV